MRTAVTVTAVLGMGMPAVVTMPVMIPVSVTWKSELRPG
jgi:hypothetical protein